MFFDILIHKASAVSAAGVFAVFLQRGLFTFLSKHHKSFAFYFDATAALMVFVVNLKEQSN